MVFQYASIYSTIFTVWAVVAVIAVVIGFIATTDGLGSERFNAIGKISAAMTAIFIVIAIVRNVQYKEQESQYYEDATAKAASYSVFVNGVAVESDRVVLTDYDVKNIRWDDAKQEIYISIPSTS